MLKVVQGDGDARSTHPEHQRQELMCERNIVSSETIIGHEQLSREALLQRGGPIRERCIGGLIQEAVSERKKHTFK